MIVNQAGDLEFLGQHGMNINPRLHFSFASFVDVLYRFLLAQKAYTRVLTLQSLDLNPYKMLV